jgi:hypothetical protein
MNETPCFPYQWGPLVCPLPTHVVFMVFLLAEERADG